MNRKSIKSYLMTSAAVLSLATSVIPSVSATERQFDLSISTASTYKVTKNQSIVTISFVDVNGQRLSTNEESAIRVLMTTDTESNPITVDSMNAAIRTFSFDASLDQIGDLTSEKVFENEDGTKITQISKYIVIGQAGSLTDDLKSNLQTTLDKVNEVKREVTGNTNNNVDSNLGKSETTTSTEENTSTSTTVETSDSSTTTTTEVTTTTNASEEVTDQALLDIKEKTRNGYVVRQIVIVNEKGEVLKNAEGKEARKVVFVENTLEAISKARGEFLAELRAGDKPLITNQWITRETYSSDEVDVTFKEDHVKLVTDVVFASSNVQPGYSLTEEERALMKSVAEKLRNELSSTFSSLKDVKNALDGKVSTTNPETQVETTSSNQSEEDKKLLEDKKKLEEQAKTQQQNQTEFAKTGTKNVTTIVLGALGSAVAAVLYFANRKKSAK